MNFVARTLLPFVLVAPVALVGQAADSLDLAVKVRIDRIATQVLSQTGVPSASLAVVKDGKVVFAQAYGKSRLAPSVAATPDMR